MLHKRIHRIRFVLEYLFLAVLILFAARIATHYDARHGDRQIGERVGLAQKNPVPKPDVLVFMKMAVLADHYPKALFVSPIRHCRRPSLPAQFREQFNSSLVTPVLSRGRCELYYAPACVLLAD